MKNSVEFDTDVLVVVQFIIHDYPGCYLIIESGMNWATLMRILPQSFANYKIHSQHNSLITLMEIIIPTKLMICRFSVFFSQQNKQLAIIQLTTLKTPMKIIKFFFLDVEGN